MPIPALFTPLTIAGLTLRNRIVLSPMCQYYAVDGAVTEWHLAHHARYALGGLGAALVEATGVTPEGRTTHGCTGLYSDDQIPGFAEIAALYRRHGTSPGIQLTHSGRKASAARPWDGAAPLERDGPEPGWETIAPSAIPVRDGWPTPRAMTLADIDRTVLDFQTAARRALAAGFDFVELHGAHGYLLHSFLSPISNKRTDEFGGTLANRMRFPIMVSRAIREIWPSDKPLFYRTSAVDNVDGGLSIDDTVIFARALSEAGVDVMDCSAGGIAGPIALAKQTEHYAGFQVPYAEAVRAGSPMKTMAVGLIVEPRMAERIVASGQADLVALARELIADPNWAYRAARELGLDDPHAVLPPSYAFYLRRRPVLTPGVAPGAGA
ncbi:MAG: NADH:flavin oxidoreductase/NADH oxidase [Rhizobiaceae bacterium]|nr:NADH:flavin oxidoreductase/NADH oxidase [Rhizobiaceae bacterium]